MTQTVIHFLFIACSSAGVTAKFILRNNSYRASSAFVLNKTAVGLLSHTVTAIQDSLFQICTTVFTTDSASE